MTGEFADDSARDKSEAARQAVRHLWKLVFLPPVVAVMFLLAGRWDWVMGWVFVAVFFVLGPLVSCMVLIPRQPELVLERLKRHKPVKPWDKALYPLLSVCAVVGLLILPPLDFRFGWSPPLPSWLPWAAVIVGALGYLLAIWAMASNPFFARIAYVQKDRGHRVATGGPYGIVRHPGYVGVSMLMLASPVILGSLWSLIPAGLVVVLIVVRTVFEDHMLHEELDGYRDYAQRVRYRLLPGLW
jgi:protein-S-isoprenylcysteine O-methyltransferase Ste14